VQKLRRGRRLMCLLQLIEIGYRRQTHNLPYAVDAMEAIAELE
jgi:hypothetical protein